jgi:two-component system sensor histidine kinase VicK
LTKSVKKEAAFLLPHAKAMKRLDRIGSIGHLINASKNGVSIKIICPLTEENSEIVKEISERAPDIIILNGNNCPAGIVIIDNAKFFKAELRTPKAEEFSEAIGFAVYSNSKLSVDSFKSIFELLWNERVLNEQLKRADEMQKEFINIASHEMKTPTQAILGYTELIQRHPEKGQQMVQAISRNAVRLQKLTNDILDVTRIESQSLKLKKEQFNLNDLISSVVEDYKAHIEKQKDNVKLFYNLKNDIVVMVEADRERITQVISNLLSNAIKFTKDGGYIYINLDSKGEQVIVSVKDTGTGIDPQILPKLFTKFATKSEAGTGLGLFISKSIVEAHSGRIWAENNTVEKGAKFAFSLPLRDIRSSSSLSD